MISWSSLFLGELAWGFLGPHYARFSTFVRTPRELRDTSLLKLSAISATIRPVALRS
jgi:cytochrome b